MKKIRIIFLYSIIIFGFLPFCATAGGGDGSANPTGGFGSSNLGGSTSSSQFEGNPTGGFGDEDIGILAPPPPPDEPVPFENAGIIVVFAGLLLGTRKIIKKTEKISLD